MSYDEEIQRLTEIECITNGKSSYLDMDEAFCARLRMAITAGCDKEGGERTQTSVHNRMRGAPSMPLSALLPLALLALIGIIALYAVYRVGA
jgi:hypothetical protein